MKKFLSIILALTCLSIFGCSNKNCITLSEGDEFCVVRTDDCKEFYTNRVLHRVDGPAIICNNGHREWWIDGEETTESEIIFLEQLRILGK